MHNLVGLIVLFPTIGFLINGLFGRKIGNERVIGTIGSTAVGLSFIFACGIFIEQLLAPPDARYFIVPMYSWITAGGLDVSIAYQIDQLSILMVLVVTGVGFLIHVYSIGYMQGDRGFWRFFAYLNLFIVMMLNLVLADNYVLLFLGWEGVGLCSYLLIGFWYDRKFSGTGITWTGEAANKAFWVNRIGDFAFMLGMFILFRQFGSLRFTDVFYGAGTMQPGSTEIVAATLLLFIGATGKSAQLPLFVWLPDAMAGPTPVSALIHAATMVTAGVYMIARNSLLFSLAPITLNVIAVVGVLTAFIAASIGIAQNDIKKVLAYSTVSQLGFMFIALGVGAFSTAMFHLMTHAFFKACLFLGSGSVIHAMHGEQDINRMGGLKTVMPMTFATFLISSFAIAGFPPLAGFFSKDEILWNAWSMGSPVLWVIGALTALMTAFYMFRMVTLTFYGDARWSDGVHPHESPATMTVPLIILAALAVIGGLVGIPSALGGGNALHQWLEPVFAQAGSIMMHTESENHMLEYLLMALSVILSVIGFLYGRKIYLSNINADDTFRKRAPALANLLSRKYYVDEAYDNAIVKPLLRYSETFLTRIVDNRLIDGFINATAYLMGWIANRTRLMQTGILQNYVTVIVLGILVILSIVMFG